MGSPGLNISHLKGPKLRIHNLGDGQQRSDTQHRRTASERSERAHFGQLGMDPTLAITMHWKSKNGDAVSPGAKVGLLVTKKAGRGVVTKARACNVPAFLAA